MREILENYIVFISGYESLVREKYGVEKNISLWSASHHDIFDKQGMIKDYVYFYHGAGCRLERDGVVCEYDTAPLNGYEIKFSYWKFLEFIKTNPKYNKLDITRNYMEDELDKLVKKGLLSWCVIDGYSYNILQVLASKL